MSYRAIAAIPFLTVAAAATVFLLVPEDARPLALRIVSETVKTMALVGLAAGALVFRPGDYLRRGWGLSAVCYALLLVRDTSIIAWPGQVSPAVETARALLIVAANACVVVGTWTLARAWRVAGLDLPTSEGVRRAAVGVAVVASLLFAGSSLVVDVQVAMHQPTRWWTVASDLGDLLALPVIAPVAMTAFAVKEGTLKWPWGLLATSLGAWLLYDGVLTLPALLSIEDHGGFRLAGDCFRVFAGSAALAAGLAQRRAMQELDAPAA